MPARVRYLLEDILGIGERLLFPEYCAVCGEWLRPYEQVLCLKCYYDLPVVVPASSTWGCEELRGMFDYRVPDLVQGLVIQWLYQGPVPLLIRQMKFQKKRRLALWMGTRLGYLLLTEYSHWQFHAILPVPVSIDREFVRGFNQTELLAQGIQKVFWCEKKQKLPILQNVLIRTPYGTPFSQRGTADRLSVWKKPEDRRKTFQVLQPHILQGQSLLVVDDVFTTGTTLLQVVEILAEYHPRRIYLACVAGAHRLLRIL